MTTKDANIEMTRSRSITVLFIALGLYCAFLMSKRSELLFEESRGHLVPLAVFNLLAPTTRAELILIAIIVVATFLYLRSLRRKSAAAPIKDSQVSILARTSPFRVTSVAIGWSLFWPLFILNTIFQVVVLYTQNAMTSVFLHLAFYVMLLWLAIYVLKHEINSRYGVFSTGVVWPFLWRAIAVTLFANFVLFEFIEREKIIHSFLLIEWLVAKCVIALAQCVGLGWAAHRCLAIHSRRDGMGGA